MMVDEALKAPNPWDFVESEVVWTLQEYEIVKDLAKTLDPQKTAKNLGLANSTIGNVMCRPHVRKKFNMLISSAVSSLDINAHDALKDFMELKDKLNRDYDAGEKKLASSLVAMNKNYLKMTDLLKEDEMGGAPKVNISINLNPNNGFLAVKDEDESE